MEGTVKWFNPGKGYGFIAGDGIEDVFVHQSSIEGSEQQGLKVGQRVSFEVVSGPKGNQASKVKVIGESKQGTEDKIRALRKESREILRDLKKRRDRR